MLWRWNDVGYAAAALTQNARLDSARPEALIRRYYGHFNERRLQDAASLIAPHAVLAQALTGRQQPGPKGYLEFAEAWLQAFPEAVLTVENVSSPDGVVHTVSLVSTGKHLGTLGVGGLVFRPHGVESRLELREVLEIRDGAIVYASLSFDLPDIIRQLAKVDTVALLGKLRRLRVLSQELDAAHGDADRSRELIQRIGLELDAARHLVRPYFK